jgi:hypothetical protein
MTDRRISELDAATLPLAGTEQVALVQGGETRRVPIADARDVALRAEVEEARGERTTLGLRISTISNFASANPGTVIVNRYYDQALHGSNPGTRAGAANEMTLSPFYTSNPLRIDEIGVSIATAVSGALGRCAIYSSGVDGWPDEKLFEGPSNLDFSTTGFHAHSIDLRFDTGRQYYLALLTSSTATYRTVSTSSALNFGLPAGANAVQYGTVIRRIHTFADPMPSSFGFSVSDVGTSGANFPPPSIRMRAAAL